MKAVDLSLSATVRNYGDKYFSFPNAVIPAKAGIQVVWIPTMAKPGLDARLRGHDGWKVRLVYLENTAPQLRMAVLSWWHLPLRRPTSSGVWLE